MASNTWIRATFNKTSRYCMRFAPGSTKCPLHPQDGSYLTRSHVYVVPVVLARIKLHTLEGAYLQVALSILVYSSCAFQFSCQYLRLWALQCSPESHVLQRATMQSPTPGRMSDAEAPPAATRDLSGLYPPYWGDHEKSSRTFVSAELFNLRPSLGIVVSEASVNLSHVGQTKSSWVLGA